MQILNFDLNIYQYVEGGATGGRYCPIYSKTGSGGGHIPVTLTSTRQKIDEKTTNLRCMFLHQNINENPNAPIPLSGI